MRLLIKFTYKLYIQCQISRLRYQKLRLENESKRLKIPKNDKALNYYLEKLERDTYIMF
jgi:hypothetical protein